MNLLADTNVVQKYTTSRAETQGSTFHESVGIYSQVHTDLLLRRPTSTQARVLLETGKIGEGGDCEKKQINIRKHEKDVFCVTHRLTTTDGTKCKPVCIL